MSNMSYCRFENTLHDLHDCWANWEDPTSETELKARKRLLALCIEIADACGDEEDLR